MFGIGVQELGLILVIALLVFGPKRMPELARMLGRGMGEFRRASNDLRQSLALDELQNDLHKEIRSAEAAVGSIHKPAPPDESAPAQAGDGFEEAAKKAAAAAAGTAAVGAQPTDDDATPASAQNASGHPGELPLGNDEEHHDEPSEPTSDEDADSESAEGSKRS